MFDDTPLAALLLGFISAISLIIGAAIGLVAKPRAITTSVAMAFGAGALLFALSIEIVAHAYHLAGFWPLAIGCVAGGLLFELLNQTINSRGGFLRKTATLIHEVARTKHKRASDVVDHLARMAVFRALPPEQIARLVPEIDLVRVPKGTVVLTEGEPGSALYLIEAGSADVVRRAGNTLVATLRAGEAFGEMALLSGGTHNSSVVAGPDGAELYRVRREDFDRLLRASPETHAILTELAREREHSSPPVPSGPSAENWKNWTLRRLDPVDLSPTRTEIQAATKAHVSVHGSAVLGIWLGILLDAIPESLVIGMSLIGATAVPWGLIAGVFLANLPEAMSSSVVMRQQHFSVRRILVLWSVIVIVTSIGAAFGNAALREVSPAALAVIEGCAAGAMLTSIAETMLPEAYHQGGWVVGLSTLAGFVTALGIKSLSSA